MTSSLMPGIAMYSCTTSPIFTHVMAVPGVELEQDASQWVADGLGEPALQRPNGDPAVHLIGDIDQDFRGWDHRSFLLPGSGNHESVEH